MSFRQRIAALLGISAYALPLPQAGPSLESPQVEKVRRAFGGQLSNLPQTQTRWHLTDLESAEHMADVGDISQAARLMRSVRKDGTFAGVLSTRTGGLVHLPKRFRGDPDIVQSLEVGHDNVRSVFDEMFPPSELSLLAADGLLLGIAVGELVPVEGRDYPVLVRLDPEWLRYRWNENRWYYSSIAGLLPITPGDGRWVLHVPGGRVAPWQNALWRAIGRSWIDKEHARLHKSNWEGKLANPARVAVAPQAASEEQKLSWFRKVMAWGVNTVFSTPPGYDVKLLESNGRGFESFNTTIDRADREMIVAVAGQVVTTDGGAGFQNSDIHKAIRSDLIKDTAEGLAYTLNTQGIPPFVAARWGDAALERMAVVEWDTTPAKDLRAEADAIQVFAQAVEKANESFASYGMRVDATEMATRFGVKLVALESQIDAPSIALAPADVVKIVTVNEGRASAGLGPLTTEDGQVDPAGNLIVSEFAAALDRKMAPPPVAANDDISEAAE